MAAKPRKFAVPLTSWTVNRAHGGAALWVFFVYRDPTHPVVTFATIIARFRGRGDWNPSDGYDGSVEFPRLETSFGKNGTRVERNYFPKFRGDEHSANRATIILDDTRHSREILLPVRNQTGITPFNGERAVR